MVSNSRPTTRMPNLGSDLIVLTPQNKESVLLSVGIALIRKRKFENWKEQFNSCLLSTTSGSLWLKHISCFFCVPHPHPFPVSYFDYIKNTLVNFENFFFDGFLMYFNVDDMTDLFRWTVALDCTLQKIIYYLLISRGYICNYKRYMIKPLTASVFCAVNVLKTQFRIRVEIAANPLHEASRSRRHTKGGYS